jgi:hypothetical protein
MIGGRNHNQVRKENDNNRIKVEESYSLTPCFSSMFERHQLKSILFVDI